MLTRFATILATATLATAGLLQAQQPLSLSDAIARADSHAYANRMATADGDRQAAQKASTLRGLLPTMRAEGGYLRTTDPLNAFGFQLRQRSLTQASFDPARLNYPAPIGTFGTGLPAMSMAGTTSRPTSRSRRSSTATRRPPTTSRRSRVRVRSASSATR